ncbi:MAG TPA: hypothetical protein DCK93_07705 [Blastocatellia bacterium]|nr:hypothetical protein [Blastocatellia bacterium]
MGNSHFYEVFYEVNGTLQIFIIFDIVTGKLEILRASHLEQAAHHLKESAALFTTRECVNKAALLFSPKYVMRR